MWLAGAGLVVPGQVASALRPPRLPVRAAIEAHNSALLGSLFTLKVPVARWDWIVVHHTAAPYATLKGIDRYHRKKFGGGIQYHFLIGNGKRTGLGMIELGKWPSQERSIHLFKPEKAPRGIAICLVGNLEKKRPHKRQIAALVALTRALMKGTGVDVEHVTTHRGVDGRLTQCPGKHFNRKRFLAGLR